MNLIKSFWTWLTTPSVADFDKGYLWAEKELAKGRKRWEIVLVREHIQSEEYERGVATALADAAIKERLGAVQKMKDLS